MRFAVLFLCFSASIALYSQTNKTDFLDRWDHSETYLLGFVQLMPDSLYSYRPQEGMFSFDEQLHHITDHLAWISNDYLISRDQTYQFKPYEVLPPQERIASVRSIFQEVREAVLALDDTDLEIRYEFKPAGESLRTIDLLYLLLDHTTHHRGQLVVYLRLNGIKPPPYVGW